MKFLNLFCQGYEYALITIDICVILNVITKFNEIDYKKKKFLLCQIILLILSIFSIYFYDTIFDNFMIIIMLSIVVPLNWLMYSEEITNVHS